MPAKGQALLAAAAERIAKGQAQYGAPEEMFATVAELWSTLLGTKVTAQDVTQCMIALKMVRARNAGDAAVLKDSLLDVAGYAACGWELDRGES
jgi:hypothetical protein